MTFPHVEPDFKKHNDDLSDHLQPEYIQRVIDINNAVMEAHLNCENKNADCLECGNAECSMVFEAQAELQGMTLKELMESWRKQREQDEKAAEKQTERFAYYEQKYLEGLVTDKKEKIIKEVNLFNFEKAA